MKLTVVILVLLASAAAAEGDDCASALAQARKAASTQDYAQFDQTPSEGWRLLAEQRSCFVEAGNLIDFYVENRSDLRDSQKVNLSFHAGQVYAFAGRNDQALVRFKRAVVNPGAPPAFKWSEYVLATIAFLEHDAEVLVKNRDIIAAAAGYSPNASNLKVVELLIKNFDRPYKEALRQAP